MRTDLALVYCGSRTDEILDDALLSRCIWNIGYGLETPPIGWSHLQMCWQNI